MLLIKLQSNQTVAIARSQSIMTKLLKNLDINIFTQAINL